MHNNVADKPTVETYHSTEIHFCKALNNGATVRHALTVDTVPSRRSNG